MDIILRVHDQRNRKSEPTDKNDTDNPVEVY